MLALVLLTMLGSLSVATWELKNGGLHSESDKREPVTTVKKSISDLDASQTQPKGKESHHSHSLECRYHTTPPSRDLEPMDWDQLVFETGSER